jgi:hypothetical protein
MTFNVSWSTARKAFGCPTRKVISHHYPKIIYGRCARNQWLLLGKGFTGFRVFGEFNSKCYKPRDGVVTTYNVTSRVYARNFIVIRKMRLNKIKVISITPEAPPIPSREDLPYHPAAVVDTV